jgi:hypothetical protein
MIAHRRLEVCHPVKQRFWKRILIVDDDVDVTTTFKAGIEENNNYNDANNRIKVYANGVSSYITGIELFVDGGLAQI